MVVILSLYDFKFFLWLINFGFNIGIFELRDNPVFKFFRRDIEKVGEVFKWDMWVDFAVIFEKEFFSSLEYQFRKFVQIKVLCTGLFDKW